MGFFVTMKSMNIIICWAYLCSFVTVISFNTIIYQAQ